MEMSSSRCCCISVKETNIPVPLTAIKVSINVRGYLVDVDSTLCYENKGTNPIEAIFTFPVDENGAVYKFEMQIDGKTVIAECQEKQEAKETYDEAVEQGYTATYLGENDSTSDVFTCKLGNLQPGKNASVRFAFISELQIVEDGILDFVLPTLLNPRYNPSPEKGGSQEPTKIKYVKGCDQPYEFEINTSIEGLGKLVDITSAKDKLDVSYELENKKAHIKLSDKFVADHDFGFKIKVEDAHQPRVLIEKGKDNAEGFLKNDVMMLNFFPVLKRSGLFNKHEFIFIIDRSGSMGGSRIKDARESLLLFLKSLPTGCYFNIIGFGSQFNALFKEGSVLYSEAHLKRALAYQECLEADMGGTEIFEPLNHVYKQPLIRTHSRQILLITDGEVFNTSAIIKLVQRYSHNTKVFTLGIGEGASTSLIKGVARAGRGRAEFVKTGEKMQPVLMRLLKYAMQPSINNVTIDWKLGGSVNLTQIPQLPPPIFNGDRLILYAIINEPSVLDGRVELRFAIGEDKLEFVIKVDATRDVLDHTEQDFMLVHRMAAKLQLKHLQDSDDAEKKTNKAAIVELSLASNVVSSYTAMVGVDKSTKKPVDGSMITCTVPNVVDPTLSFPGGGRMAFGGPIMHRSLLKAVNCPAHVKSKSLKIACRNAEPAELELYSYQKSVHHEDAAYLTVEGPESNIKPTSIVLEIISFVEFDGQWKFSKELLHILSLKEDDVRKSSVLKDLDIWTTAIVLSYLETKCADEKEEWEMVNMKAINWMLLQNMENLTTDELLAHAAKILI